MTARRFCFALILLPFVAALTAQEKGNFPGLKKLQDEYAADLAKAKAAYDEAAKKLGERQRERLQELLDARTKAGDLDGALQVRNEMKKVSDRPEMEQPVRFHEFAARLKLIEAMPRFTWSSINAGWTDKFSFQDDGYVYLKGKRGESTWAATSPTQLVVTSPKGHIDVVEVDLTKGTLKFSYMGNRQNPPGGSWNAVKE